MEMVSTFDYVSCVAPIGFYNVVPEATVVFALVSLLAEGHLKLSYVEWRSLKA